MNAALQRLEREGVLRLGRGRIELLDLPGLLLHGAEPDGRRTDR